MSEMKTLSCETGLHFIVPRREPVFHLVGHEGAHGLVTLDIVKIWARQVLADGNDFTPYYAELYVGMPNESRLIRCEVGIAGTSKKPKGIITSDGVPGIWVAGVLWTCDL